MRSFSRDLRFLRQLLRKTKHRYKDLLLVFPNLSFNFQPTTPSLEEDSSETVAHEIEIDLIITFKKTLRKEISLDILLLLQIPLWLGKGCVCKLFDKLQSTLASCMNSFLAEVSELSPQRFLIPKRNSMVATKNPTVAFVVPINSYAYPTKSKKGSAACVDFGFDSLIPYRKL